jgi:hypothetical protein
VWVTKSHYPINNAPKFTETYPAQKVFIVVRNPVDTFPSLNYLRMLTSHSLMTEEEIYKKHPEWWATCVKFFIERLKKVFASQLKLAKKVPVYFVRYEDLRNKKGETLHGLFRFLLDAPSIEGTICEQRVQEVASGDP